MGLGGSGPMGVTMIGGSCAMAGSTALVAAMNVTTKIASPERNMRSRLIMPPERCVAFRTLSALEKFHAM